MAKNNRVSAKIRLFILKLFVKAVFALVRHLAIAWLVMLFPEWFFGRVIVREM